MNSRVLAWTLPKEFTKTEARAVAKDLEQRAKDWRELENALVGVCHRVAPRRLEVSPAGHRESRAGFASLTPARGPGEAIHP